MCYFLSSLRVVSELRLAPSARAALVGISRLWVHKDFQRTGVATSLVDAMRGSYNRPTIVNK